MGTKKSSELIFLAHVVKDLELCLMKSSFIPLFTLISFMAITKESPSIKLPRENFILNPIIYT